MFFLTKIIPRSGLKKIGKFSRQFSQFEKILVSDEVRFALENDKPIVALESTIITHGMPFPDNVKCALEVEDVVRKQGAIAATIAIIGGTIKVGLDQNDITRLGDVQTSQPIKTSRRDLAYVVSKELNGGTTVSGTLIIANKVGLKIFATGGLGGVHREGENTFDISADLIELGKSNVAVISSGVKSILDIPKTLEYLETQGVFVATFGTSSRNFPAFYSRKSGFYVPYSVNTPLEAARIIHNSQLLDLQSGMLFAVPVPEEFALDEKIINDVIEKALAEAKEKGIRGKEITPFLLGRIGEITAGKSLVTNIALVKNNAESAAKIAVALSNMKRDGQRSRRELKKERSIDESKPIVIGGSNLDLSVKLVDSQLKMDGRIHLGKFSLSAGGVARNICEALWKLDCQPNFISAVGHDSQGDILKKFIPSLSLVETIKGSNTSQCTVVFNSSGDCIFLMGDMDIHQEITPELIKSHEAIIKNAPLIVFDGNLSTRTIQTVLELAEKYNIPAFFEPTDVVISSKPFESGQWGALKFISPNINELRHIAEYLKIVREENYASNFEEVVDLSKKIAKDYVDNVLVTLGAQGIIIARRGEASESFLRNNSKNVSVRHYPAEEVQDLVNVSGAGDSLASGLIAGILEGSSEEKCVSVGFAAARKALFVPEAVAECLFDKTHEAWRSSAKYTTIV